MKLFTLLRWHYLLLLTLVMLISTKWLISYSWRKRINNRAVFFIKWNHWNIKHWIQNKTKTKQKPIYTFRHLCYTRDLWWVADIKVKDTKPQSFGKVLRYTLYRWTQACADTLGEWKKKSIVPYPKALQKFYLKDKSNMWFRTECFWVHTWSSKFVIWLHSKR